MKNIIVILGLLFCISVPTFAVEDIVSLDDEQTAAIKQEEKIPVLQAEVTFDWLDISQVERDKNIEHYRDMIFAPNVANEIYFSKQDFKKKYKPYYSDKEFKHHYMLTNNGVTEDEDAKYCAFYYRKNTLIMYAIEYKNNPQNAFYYSAFGKLYYTDVRTKEYPNFPYISMQYDRGGHLKSAIYFVSKDLQYMYSPEKEFQGVWYKEKMFDKNGKQVLTRTNW